MTIKMSKTDPAFSRVDPKRSGFYIWRIENMQVTPIAKEFYGEFFRGDSYIVLSGAEEGQIPKGVNVQIKEIKGGPLDSHVHFWLGNDTSQDEAGVAAYKSVELDDLLGGSPVQHREVEGHESQRFLSYFPSGIKIKQGGAKSGFHHVDKGVFQPRLIHVKGKRNPRFSECPEIDWEQMNHGDCFILDLGNVIFPWLGANCNRTEKMKTVEHCCRLRDERGGKANIVFVDDGQEDKLDKESKQLFEKYLNIKDRNKIKAEKEAGDDEASERILSANIKLFSCKEEEGTLRIQEVKPGPLYRKDLVSDDSFIIDNGPTGSWLWIGRKASPKEKKEAMRNAVGFLKKKGYPSDTKVTRVVEGAEPSDFKCLFKDWPQPPPPGKVYSRSRIAKTVQTKFDATTLHNNQALAAESQMVDDGSGKVEVWRIEDFQMVPLENIHYGEFYGGDCYVILYTYNVQGREAYIIYYWLGLKSTTDEQGTAALMAVQLDDKYNGKPVQVRVVQYKEPPHFMALFGGKMVIFEGGKAGWTKGKSVNGVQYEGPGDKYMLQVRGTSALTCKAVQVPLRASSLNSNDVFVIFTKSAVYSWAGKGCTGDEREMAKNIAARSPRVLTTVFEGQEKPDFWNVLGGKEEYASEKLLQDEGSHPCRLFHLSNARGYIHVEEVYDFVQSDLIEDDVMLLDAWESIYIWFGKNSNKAEREASQTCAIEYLKTDPAGRDIDTPILCIKQGFEPPSFTGFFGIWDRDIWSKGLSFEELKKQVGESNIPIVEIKQNGISGSPDFNEVPKYSLVELQVAAEELPSGVDPNAREIHLRDDEFKKVFNMSYSDFNKLPGWKQKQMKKSFKLF
ncbi:advillin-like isoform X3 [Biomphalaria glabrata]|uniref:Advillin-like isoform X3 n=1 Tax=Biomphalaria glabrata TaxID=6526 RepID=A0A9W2Z4J1_BIOGL|nr:advillin-like isoform X3 [Biomphalaria glabrata]